MLFSSSNCFLIRILIFLSINWNFLLYFFASIFQKHSLISPSNPTLILLTCLTASSHCIELSFHNLVRIVAACARSNPSLFVVLAYLSELTELSTKFAMNTPSTHLVGTHRSSISSICKLIIPHLTWYISSETCSTCSWVQLLLDHIRLGHYVHDGLIIFTR